MHFQHSALISWLVGHKMVGLCHKAEKCQQRFAYKGHKMPSLFYSSKGKNTDPKPNQEKNQHKGGLPLDLAGHFVLFIKIENTSKFYAFLDFGFF